MEKKVGAFVPQNNRRNIKTEIKQIKLYEDERARFDLARKLKVASISNLRANLRYYERRKPDEVLQDTIAYITGLIQKLNEAKDITGLMTLEARARQKYYQCFNVIMAESGFTLKREPRDHRRIR